MATQTNSFPTDFIAAIGDAVMAREGRLQGNEWLFLCPAHDDHRPSARWHPAKQVWFCDACSGGGGALDLARRLDVRLPDSRNHEKPRSKTTHVVMDADGAVIALHERKGAWRHPDR